MIFRSIDWLTGGSELKNIWNQSNFTFFFIVFLLFEIVALLFQLYDIDSPSPDLSQHDFIGQFTTTLASLVSSPGGVLIKPLVNKQGKPTQGILTLRVEELRECNQYVTFTLQGDKLPKLDWFGKSE